MNILDILPYDVFIHLVLLFSTALIVALVIAVPIFFLNLIIKKYNKQHDDVYIKRCQLYKEAKKSMGKELAENMISSMTPEEVVAAIKKRCKKKEGA